MTRMLDPGISRFVDSRSARHEQDGPFCHDSEALRHARQHRESDARPIDQALHKRLSQLRMAMGDEPATNGVERPAPLAVKTSPTTQKPPSLFSVHTLLATSLVSACIGAAAAWGTAVVSVGSRANPPAASHERVAAAIPAPQTVPAPTTLAPEAPPAQDGKTEEEQLSQLLENWRQAWSARDVDAYLSHYSERFAPQGGQARAAWAESRRKNIAGRTGISVTVHALQIERVDDQRFRLAFLQDYAAGNYREEAQPKVLELVREGPAWRIVSELQSG